MPTKPMRPCSYPGCRELTDQGRCAKHPQVRHYDDRRLSAAKRGYDGQWRKARAGFLKKHPLCVDCEKEGQLNAATEVDHIIPHKGDKELFWDRNNWQGLCKMHHSRKTAREDGGFGRG